MASLADFAGADEIANLAEMIERTAYSLINTSSERKKDEKEDMKKRHY